MSGGYQGEEGDHQISGACSYPTAASAFSILSLGAFASKSDNARWIQYRARKQAVAYWANRLLTRAVLYQRPNVVWFDLVNEGASFVSKSL